MVENATTSPGEGRSQAATHLRCKNGGNVQQLVSNQIMNKAIDASSDPDDARAHESKIVPVLLRLPSHVSQSDTHQSLMSVRSCLCKKGLISLVGRDVSNSLNRRAGWLDVSWQAGECM